MSGSISRGKNDPSQSLQMMERPLLTSDELKALPKGRFIVMKTGTHPMKTRLRLFSDWGITFGSPYSVSEKAQREVAYANRRELEINIMKKNLTMSPKRVSDGTSVEVGEDTCTPNGKMLRYE